MKGSLHLFLKTILGKSIYMKSIFFIRHKYWPNLKEPKTYNEKIQFRKINSNNILYANYADKVEFRKTVSSLIGDDYLIPSYGIFEKLTLKVWESLPNSFVIKASHGSGEKYIEIIKDKSALEFEKIKKKFDKALKDDFGRKVNELFYSIIPPKILIEKYLDFGDKDGILDYKIHVFRREDEIKIFIQVDSGRFTNHERNFYDENWNQIEMQINSKYNYISKKINKPKGFKEMKEIALKLSNKFSYVRVDFFNVNKKNYLGEVTFCHGSGFENFMPKEKDLEWGKFWGIDPRI